MSKILSPGKDYILDEEKIILVGEVKEKAKKGIVITDHTICDLYKWNKQDPQYCFKFETELEIWVKVRKITLPHVIVDHFYKWEEKLSKNSWWYSIPTHIKFALLIVLVGIIAVLYFMFKKDNGI
ncbi:hypothetical protein [Candidatus Mycoplasma haematohominis]|uniref:hypothetical protein n=1 Tax=Candidatus Mycoplasma haematohominis TaxID=1494318 RepID=UPI001C0A6AAF|nr:hypothetical protein [Candidatus Mycoplasma haemohominis]